jgi:hypothetical protein
VRGRPDKQTLGAVWHTYLRGQQTLLQAKGATR